MERIRPTNKHSMVQRTALSSSQNEHAEGSRKGWATAATSFLALLVFAIVPDLAEAQCSMCRAVTNSNQLSNDAFKVGNGLNNAIIYLMLTPYVLAVIFFYAFYRKQIKAWFRSRFSGAE